jgi:hypothetical protein
MLRKNLGVGPLTISGLAGLSSQFIYKNKSYLGVNLKSVTGGPDHSL